MWKWVAVFAPVLGLLGLLAYGFTTNPREIRSPLVSRPAAPFALPLFDGGRFALADLRGQVVVANFWASWCVPCREEAPLLEAAWRTYRDRGVVFLGLNVQDEEAAARAFIQEFGLTYANGADLGGRIAINYGVYGIPELFVIGPDGRINYKHVGTIDGPTLQRQVEHALRDGIASGEGRGGQYQSIR